MLCRGRSCSENRACLLLDRGTERRVLYKLQRDIFIRSISESLTEYIIVDCMGKDHVVCICGRLGATKRKRKGGNRETYIRQQSVFYALPSIIQHTSLSSAACLLPHASLTLSRN